MATSRIIVIGASAGGLEAILTIVRKLPRDLPASIFIVLHSSSSGTTFFTQLVQRACPFVVYTPADGEPINDGHIYLPRADHHLTLRPGVIRVTLGPKVNGFRPAIDPLFRTAARSYGPRAVGVILSGLMDDGTLGLLMIKRQGGVAIVQDPADAMFPDMPENAIANVTADHVVPAAKIADVLQYVVSQRIHEEAEAMLAKDVPTDVAVSGGKGLEDKIFAGPPSGLTCPHCGGSLWELKEGKITSFRCHTGHGFTTAALMEEQLHSLDGALWSALRALEESAEMRRRLAHRAEVRSQQDLASAYTREAAEFETRADLLREVILTRPAHHPRPDQFEHGPKNTKGRMPKRAQRAAPESTKRVQPRTVKPRRAR